MEIQNTTAIFNFLGNLTWAGTIALVILAALIVAFLSLSLLEKLFDPTDKGIKRRITFAVVAIIVVCGIVLKLEANHAKTDLASANSIKFFMIANKQRYKSLKGLASEIVLNSDDTLCANSVCATDKVKEIKKIVKNHPDQFLITRVFEDENGGEIQGLEVIDEAAGRVIDSAIEKRLSYYQDEIVDFMLSHHRDTLSYDDIERLDHRCEWTVLEMILSHSKELLLALKIDGHNYVILNRQVLKKTDYPTSW